MSFLEAEDTFEVGGAKGEKLAAERRVVFGRRQVKSVETGHGLEEGAVLEGEETDLSSIALQEARVLREGYAKPSTGTALRPVVNWRRCCLWERSMSVSTTLQNHLTSLCLSHRLPLYYVCFRQSSTSTSSMPPSTRPSSSPWNTSTSPRGIISQNSQRNMFSSTSCFPLNWYSTILSTNNPLFWSSSSRWRPQGTNSCSEYSPQAEGLWTRKRCSLRYSSCWTGWVSRYSRLLCTPCSSSFRSASPTASPTTCLANTPDSLTGVGILSRRLLASTRAARRMRCRVCSSRAESAKVQWPERSWRKTPSSWENSYLVSRVAHSLMRPPASETVSPSNEMCSSFRKSQASRNSSVSSTMRSLLTRMQSLPSVQLTLRWPRRCLNQRTFSWKGFSLTSLGEHSHRACTCSLERVTLVQTPFCREKTDLAVKVQVRSLC